MKGAMLRWATDSSIREAPSQPVAAYLGGLGLEQFRRLPSGSVGRGDRASESDTDVLAVSDNPPKDLTHRLDLIFDARDIAPEVEPIGWTTEAWASREARGEGVVDIPPRETMLLAAPDQGKPLRPPPPLRGRAGKGVKRLPPAQIGRRFSARIHARADTPPRKRAPLMKGEFTAIIEPAPEGRVWAICPEVPGAKGQGETLEEATESLRQAIQMILDDRTSDILRGLPNGAIRDTVAIGRKGLCWREG